METINEVISLFEEHYQWLFSGLGVVLIGLFFKGRVSSSNKVKQNNIIAGGDVVGRDKK